MSFKDCGFIVYTVNRFPLRLLASIAAHFFFIVAIEWNEMSEFEIADITQVISHANENAAEKFNTFKH